MGRHPKIDNIRRIVDGPTGADPRRNVTNRDADRRRGWERGRREAEVRSARKSMWRDTKGQTTVWFSGGGKKVREGNIGEICNKENYQARKPWNFFSKASNTFFSPSSPASSNLTPAEAATTTAQYGVV